MKSSLTRCLVWLHLFFLLSCSKEFLEQPPIGTAGDLLISDAKGVQSLLIGVYSVLNEGALYSGTDMPLYGVIRGAECFKGSDAGDQIRGPLAASRFDVLPDDSPLLSLWRQYFNAVSRCNQVMQILPLVKDLSDQGRKQIEAEARFLRAHYYFMLKINFRNLPWIDETVSDYRVPNTVNNNGTEFVNIWPRIASDMDFARKNLPESQSDLGRPNRWAAECYYAKILIYRACEGEYPEGFDEALAILTNVIDNGITMSGERYGLEANYHDNFDTARENGPECVWAVQMSVNDGTPTVGLNANPNGDPKYIWLYSWGFCQPTCWYADHFRTNAGGLPYLDMYDTNPNRLKDDYGLAAAPAPPEPDTFTPDTMGVDPRLDWTLCRRGIPCLDYGSFPGSSWIRSQLHGGPYMCKKWLVWKSQEGIFTAGLKPSGMKSAMNIQVIRFADVLLMAAECEARVGSLDHARDLVNRVRQRMMDNAGSPLNRVKKEDGITDAANYRIGLYPKGGPEDPFSERSTALDAILFERTLELGTEGQRFYDVVRFGKGEEIFNEFLQVEQERFDYLKYAIFTTIPDACLPIPEAAIENSLVNGKPTLTQNPGY